MLDKSPWSQDAIQIGALNPVLLPPCWLHSQTVPPLSRVTWPLAGLHTHHFSNLSGKTASIATISVKVLNLKVVGSDWTSLVHPKPITISKDYNALMGKAWVTSSLPANKRSTRQTERPRVHVHRFGGRGAF